ncbi:D-alanine--D-alanine ligase [Aquisalimonas sp.]|uniref:D-alanine--D-alanine ligase family protein n=1 Tax=unclassified Aquisalimonas TaxID=2644645 RepID=UPI0025B97FAB|nr:D-alanine--D-alanine ligase [Aquisalimonas sp.]
MTAARALTVGVLSGDPELPYSYGVDGRFSQEDRVAAETAVTTVNALDGYSAVALNNHSALLDTLRRVPPDLALNFCDTGYRNLLHHEPNVPALLELLEIPYTGAPSGSMAVCADKALVRLLAASHGIPVPNETVVDLHADPLALPALYPAMIKPNDGCGSLGVSPRSVVHDAAEALACLHHLAGEATTPRPRALIQDFLTGTEYTLGLVGNPGTGLTVLPLLEIDYSRLDPSLPPILSYGSKCDPDSPYWQALRFRRAELDAGTEAAMVEQAIWLFERLGLRDYARIDFRAGADGVPRLLDANFNPSWNPDGKLAIMAGWGGHSYGDLLRMILEAARRRYGL